MEKVKQPITANVKTYLGRWVNAYDKARIIGEITVFEKDGELSIAVSGSEDGYYPGDWKTAPASYFSHGPDKDDVVAFLANFQFDEMDAYLTINENRGLLIIAGYFSFKKNEGKSDYYVREFFHKK